MWKLWTGARADFDESTVDELLLDAIAEGDERAFLILYRRREPAIFRYAINMAGDRDLASEVVQETFLALLRESGNLNPERGAVMAWLYAVARNQILRQLTSRRRHLSLDDDDVDDPVAPGSALDDLEQGQLVELVREAIPTLPVAFREALILCDMQGLSYEEAAAAAGCPVGTVRSRLHRARALLAVKLKSTVGYTL